MSTDRQRVERVPGSRRAKLTPAPGTDPTPETTNGPDAGEPPASGPNDDRLRNDVPPHY
ncbi:hypothetical protein [Microbacterium sp. MM2322]|uniref:hypothetical protein n=1 Tax=Microbacterium sp. MM2322 TaxID=3157631 RepID=UPI0032D5901A